MRLGMLLSVCPTQRLLEILKACIVRSCRNTARPQPQQLDEASGAPPYRDIVGALNITPRKAARWRARFLELGLAGLERTQPGLGAQC